MITNDPTSNVFNALAHVIRREILDITQQNPGISVGELAKNFDVSRIAIMNHLTVLTDTNLIISQKDGRSRRLYMNAMPIQEIYERWTDIYSQQWLDRMSSIKQTAEVIQASLQNTKGNKDE